jgi:ArsR family transcriptional regulator
MSLTADQTIEALRAAGEPTRLRVLSLLAGEELSVMELSGILDQSQPRVSRHLKLMTDAGLIERFPDGARVFYRLSSDPPARRLIDTVLDLLDDAANADDDRRLEDVRRSREVAASAYFERVAPQWDRIRSLYVCETAVEAAILKAAGDGPFVLFAGEATHARHYSCAHAAFSSGRREALRALRLIGLGVGGASGESGE